MAQLQRLSLIKERIISMALKRSRRSYVLAWGWAAASGLAGTLIKPFLLPFARTHVYSDPCVPYGWSATSDRDTINVGTNCFFGYGAQVIGNVSIGRGSVVGANAVVRTDVPPFSLVVGDPASIIKRYSFRLRQWIRCSSGIQEDELDHPGEDEY